MGIFSRNRMSESDFIEPDAPGRLIQDAIEELEEEGRAGVGARRAPAAFQRLLRSRLSGLRASRERRAGGAGRQPPERDGQGSPREGVALRREPLLARNRGRDYGPQSRTRRIPGSQVPGRRQHWRDLYAQPERSRPAAAQRYPQDHRTGAAQTRPLTGSQAGSATEPNTDRRSDVILVGCVKNKRDRRGAAKDLYDSQLWYGRRRYAERSRRPWFILSAKHGLVDPDQPLEPYDRRLSELPGGQRRAWGEDVASNLEERLGSLKGKALEIHAGEKEYVVPLEPPLRRRGARLVLPLQGIDQGSQGAWYRSKGFSLKKVEAEGLSDRHRPERPTESRRVEYRGGSVEGRRRWLPCRKMRFPTPSADASWLPLDSRMTSPGRRGTPSMRTLCSLSTVYMPATTIGNLVADALTGTIRPSTHTGPQCGMKFLRSVTSSSGSKLRLGPGVSAVIPTARSSVGEFTRRNLGWFLLRI